ncbi:hypothetical protein P3T76_001745 [Phytophthora citrophthora]|uniref:Uncharacterized protein n=1 Tax=Phytophthora citrophthora TaxID=4793 RepID=A0AAD9LT94_9STRA|nr:hypothetical protein P3T76_001745 [Phytophthora citrophthora]
MPPLTATPKTLEPVVLAPTVSIDEPRDAWLEKVFGPRRTGKGSQGLAVSSDSDEEEHSYREELQQYITEATANLNEEPLEEDSSDDESESSDSDVFDFDSDDEDDYVEPPVEVPRSYRAQDLQGGMIVGGNVVLFTNWAFKRLLQRRRRLPPVPERRNSGDSEQFSSDEEDDAKGVYSGKIVEL